MNRVFRQRKELRVLTAPGNTALAVPQVNLSCSIGIPYFLFFFFFAYRIFSPKRTEHGCTAAGFSSTEMSPGPWSPPSLLCCALQAASLFKDSQAAWSGASYSSRTGAAPLGVLHSQEGLHKLSLTYWSELHTMPTYKLINGKKNADPLTAPSHPPGKLR